MPKKSSVILFILTAVLLSAIALPLAINSYIVHSIDLAEIKSAVIERVKTRTGLDMTIQGVKYSFLRGIIFTGVKIHPEKDASPEKILLQCENLVLEISLYRILRKSNPFSNLTVTEGKLNPWALKAQEWREVFRNFDESTSGAPPKDDPAKAPGKERPTNREAIQNLALNAFHLKIIPPEEIALSKQHRSLYQDAHLNMTIFPGERRYETVVFLQTGKPRPQLTVRGQWGAGNHRRMNFRFTRIPAAFALDFMKAHPMLPDEIKLLLRFPQIRSGVLEGRGSMDTFRTHMGINLSGKYSNLNAHVGDASSGLELDNARGKFDYNTVYQDFTRGPAHANFKLTQDNLNLGFEYKNVESKKNKTKVNFLALTGTLRFFPKTANAQNVLSARLPGMQLQGDAEFSCKYSYTNPAREGIEPEINVESKNFTLLLNDPLFLPEANAAGSEGKAGTKPPSPPRIQVSEAIVRQSVGKPMNIAVTGTIHNAPFRLTGTGPVYLKINPDMQEPEFVWKQTLNAELHVDGLAYHALIVPLARLPARIIRAGSAPNAPKAEDSGPLSRYRYISPDYERSFIGQTKLYLKIFLKNMRQPGRELPANLPIFFDKDWDNYFQFSVPKTSTADSQVEFKYLVWLRKPLPWHQLDFDASVKNNKIAFPELLGSLLPPGEVSLSFRLNGRGWLPHDLLNQTYSQLSFGMKGADMSKTVPARILKLKLKLPDVAFQNGMFNFYRVTSGGTFSYNNISFTTDVLDVRGRPGYVQGSYTPGEGGSFKLNYTIKKGDKVVDSGDAGLILLKDDTWVPETSY